LKLALVAPSAIVTEAGTVTAKLLLVRFTTTPPLGAAAVRDTVHGSFIPGPATARLQVRLLSSGGVGAVESPVPLRPTVVVPFAVESLVTVNWPVAAPAAVGTNCTLIVYVPPAAANVTGRLLWATPKALLETFSAEIATGDEPRLVTVTVALAVLPTEILPKLMLLWET
jgi:hypothetical protein